MTNVFAVVGEHWLVRGRLLLKGDDGQFYAYAEGHRKMVPVRPNADWLLDGDRERGDPAKQGDHRMGVARHA